jgi:hypothetical protein
MLSAKECSHQRIVHTTNAFKYNMYYTLLRVQKCEKFYEFQYYKHAKCIYLGNTNKLLLSGCSNNSIICVVASIYRLEFYWGGIDQSASLKAG